jgi:hypothetical protein
MQFDWYYANRNHFTVPGRTGRRSTGWTCGHLASPGSWTLIAAIPAAGAKCLAKWALTQHLPVLIRGRPDAAEVISAMPYQRQRCTIFSANV